MFKKEFIIGILATFLCLGVVGTVFAGDVNSEAGEWEFKFDAPETKADVAAGNNVYDQEHLALVGSEAGDWEYKFDTPDTRADVAARNYVYDQEQLALVGSEAGDWEVRFEPSNTKGREAIATKGKKVDAVCAEC